MNLSSSEIDNEEKEVLVAENLTTSDYIPWNYQDAEIGIGITGKAFKILADRRE